SHQHKKEGEDSKVMGLNIGNPDRHRVSEPISQWSVGGIKGLIENPSFPDQPPDRHIVRFIGELPEKLKFPDELKHSKDTHEENGNSYKGGLFEFKFHLKRILSPGLATIPIN